MNQAEICARLPHAGRMCLLASLVKWDNDSIVCLAVSHRDADNPLRVNGRLHAVAGVEYAAQAMALHGNLLAGTDAPATRGFLASVRDLKFTVEDLGMLDDDLHITARRLSGDAHGFIYEFEIHAGAGAGPALSGRLAAKLLAAGRPE